MTPAPGRALQMAAIVELASPVCRVMFGAPLQLIYDRTFSSSHVLCLVWRIWRRHKRGPPPCGPRPQ